LLNPFVLCFFRLVYTQDDDGGGNGGGDGGTRTQKWGGRERGICSFSLFVCFDKPSLLGWAVGRFFFACCLLYR